MNNSIDFNDMHDLSDESTGMSAKPASSVETIACIACCGTGTKTIGYVHIRQATCFMCKGTGRIRADHEKRRAAFKKGEATKAANQANKLNAWSAANPEEASWIKAKAPTFGFAFAMQEALTKYGSLTERQMETVQRLVAQDKQRLIDRANPAANTNAVDVSSGSGPILAALKQANEKGIKSPKLRTEFITFSLAKAASKNPGCVYVTTPNQDYIGKITPEGTFCPTRDCTDEQKAALVAVASDALGAAVAYGRMSGQCSCCGRELTDPKSIAKGIGPICEANFF